MHFHSSVEYIRIIHNSFYIFYSELKIIYSIYLFHYESGLFKNYINIKYSQFLHLMQNTERVSLVNNEKKNAAKL